MAHSKITLVGMYRYLDGIGDDLFSEMILPADIDRQTLIDSIMLRGAEFEVLYSDAGTMKYAIGAWSKKWQHTLVKWANVLKIAYNPLENYNRKESWSDAKAGSEDRTGSRKENGSVSDVAVSNGESKGENFRAAYDTASYSPVDKNTNDYKNNSSGASVSKSDGTESEKKSAQESSIHTGTVSGNIGVTTSQQMLQAEWEVAKLNVYESAADLFLTELSIYTY